MPLPLQTKIVLTLAISLASTLAASAMDTFFVSPTGNDNNDGLSTTAPFATIQRAANRAQPGDTVIIGGGTYRERVSLPRSGVAGSPITFQAAENEEVIVTATDLLTGFTRTPQTDDNANVYVATLAGSTTNSLLHSHELTVFVNGELVQSAKSRNSANYLRSSTWSTVDSNSGNGRTITDTDLRNRGDLVGGFIRIRTNNFAITRQKITDYNPSQGTITLANSVGSVNGRQYLVHDAQSLVDGPGEWHFNEEDNQFFIWIPGGGDPDNATVEVKRRAEAFDTNRNDHLHFRNLTLTGGDFDLDRSDNLLLEGLHIIAPDRIFSADFGTTRTGFVLSGNNNIIRNSEFEEHWSVAIRLGGSNNQIINNFFHDGSYNGSGSGAIATSNSGRQNLISHNTFTRMGRSAIVGTARENLYQFNDFSEAALITADTGAVYAFNATLENSVFRFNTFHDIRATLSNGFYIDNFSTDVAFHNNISYNTNAFGYKVNEPNSFILHYNNTSFSSGRLDIAFADFDSQYGSRFYNNIVSNIDSDLTRGSDPALSGNNFVSSAGNNFQSVASSDFRLQSNSGAVDRGREIPGVTGSFAGNAPDVGAYELGSPPFITGHDFSASPNPTYDLTGPIFGANFVQNGSFERDFQSYTTTGSPSIIRQTASNLRINGLTRYGARGAALSPGSSIAQTITGLTPNTSYTLGAWAKPIRLIIEAESRSTSSTNLSLRNVRGQQTAGPLQNNDILIYDDVDFGDGTLYDQLTLQIASSDTNDRVTLRLDSPTGPIVDERINLPRGTSLVQSSDAFDVSEISGTHTLYMVFTGNGTLGQLESFRLSKSTDRVQLQASNFGGTTIDQPIGSRLFSGPTPRFTFTTGPQSTSANISVNNPANSGFTAYIDYVSLREEPLIADVNINLNQEIYTYDPGTPNSPVFDGASRISPLIQGDLFWSGGGVSAHDRNFSSANGFNRDFIGGDAPATFNHRLAPGRYEVLLNMSDPLTPLDNMFVRAEGTMRASNIDNSLGQNRSIAFTVDVTDGMMNLELGDADTLNPLWAVNRIVISRVPGVSIIDTAQVEYIYDPGTETSPVFSTARRITPDIMGDIFWSGGSITAADRAVGNGFNRDFIGGTSPATFNHRVANGRYSLTVNLSDPETSLDNMFVRAEGTTLFSDIDRAIGENRTLGAPFTVTDGQANIEFGDADTTNPQWAVNRIVLLRLPSDPPTISPAGGEVPSGTEITLENPDNIGTIYFTLDGSDPELSNGSVNPSARSIASGSAEVITQNTTITARVRIGANWSNNSAVAVFTVLLDSDGDGLPDADELTLYGDPTDNTDGLDDFDSDGQNDRDEIVAGTALDDAGSVFRILQPTVETGPTPSERTINLEWTSISGRSYTIWSTSTLEDSNRSLVETGIIATEETTSRSFTLEGNRRFFWIEVSAP